MHLEYIKLVNFRNYSRLELYPDKGFNLLNGKNAQGKSNFLEAVFMLASTKSLRSSRDHELINYGQQVAFVEAVIKRRERGKIRVAIAIDRGNTKEIRVNSSLCRGIDLLGEVNAVSFVPEDMNIVKGSPSTRRQFLNRDISQTNNLHCHHLQQYNKVLKNRNALLRKGRPPAEIEAWDEQLSALGSRIAMVRNQYIGELSRLAAIRYARLSGEAEESLKILYRSNLAARLVGEYPSLEALEKLFREMLKENASRERIFKTTLAGIHRDDFSIRIGDRDLHIYGSQGEQRTLVLALKLATMDLIREKCGEWPILLLDDVLSELDDNRRNYLLKEVTADGMQAFMTSAGKVDLPAEIRERALIYTVQEGNVSRIG